MDGITRIAEVRGQIAEVRSQIAEVRCQIGRGKNLTFSM
jgi:hypothetical protein